MQELEERRASVSVAPRPAADRLVEGAWVTGALVAIFPGGYGFISAGEGRGQYFVRVTDVPPHLWRRGALLRFTVHPPKKGRSWAAQDVEDASGQGSEIKDQGSEAA